MGGPWDPYLILQELQVLPLDVPEALVVHYIDGAHDGGAAGRLISTQHKPSSPTYSSSAAKARERRECGFGLRFPLLSPDWASSIVYTK